MDLEAKQHLINFSVFYNKSKFEFLIYYDLCATRLGHVPSFACKKVLTLYFMMALPKPHDSQLRMWDHN